MNLNPCPLCGSTATSISEVPHERVFRICCEFCCAITVESDDKDECIELWNSIPPSPKVADPKPEIDDSWFMRRFMEVK